jgi:hypothetical protein
LSENQLTNNTPILCFEFTDEAEENNSNITNEFSFFSPLKPKAPMVCSQKVSSMNDFNSFDISGASDLRSIGSSILKMLKTEKNIAKKSSVGSFYRQSSKIEKMTKREDDSSSSEKNTVLLSLPRLSLIDIRTAEAIKLCQYLCFLISATGILYFIFSKNYLWIALEYLQVCFISCIVITLDTTKEWIKKLTFFFVFVIACCWGAVYLITHLEGLSGLYLIFSALMVSLAGIFFIGGMVYVAFIVTQISTPKIHRCVELDLILYLISLTAICYFSTNTFNNNLHMILDIRTLIMLFSGLYQEKDKTKLLSLPSFFIIMILIIISFILFALEDTLYIILANGIYVVIGFLLYREAYLRRQLYKDVEHRISEMGRNTMDLTTLSPSMIGKEDNHQGTTTTASTVIYNPSHYQKEKYEEEKRAPDPDFSTDGIAMNNMV